MHYLSDGGYLQFREQKSIEKARFFQKTEKIAKKLFKYFRKYNIMIDEVKIQQRCKGGPL
jgi:hypothetical protein